MLGSYKKINFIPFGRKWFHWLTLFSPDDNKEMPPVRLITFPPVCSWIFFKLKYTNATLCRNLSACLMKSFFCRSLRESSGSEGRFLKCLCPCGQNYFCWFCWFCLSNKYVMINYRNFRKECTRKWLTAHVSKLNL